MSKKRWRIVGLLTAVAVIAVGAVVAMDPFPGNRVYSNLHGKAGSIDVMGVTLSRRSSASLQVTGQSANIQLGKHSVHLTTEHVVLPGGRTLQIPVGCKAVELHESRQGIHVYFDGVEAH